MKKSLLSVSQAIIFTVGITVSFFSFATELHEYIATVEVTPSKENGKPWDFSGGAPDIFLKVNNFSNYTAVCQDKYKCDIPFISRKSQWYFEIYDRDLSNHDLIGKGNCNAGKVCSLDNATLTISEKKS